MTINGQEIPINRCAHCSFGSASASEVIGHIQKIHPELDNQIKEESWVNIP